MRLLLEHGADVNAQGLTGESPLHLACLTACLTGYSEAVDALVAHGADMRLRMRLSRGTVAIPGGVTALHIAAINGPIEILSLLLSRGSDPNWATHDGTTVLSLATLRDDPNTMREALLVLVAAGADLNHQDNEGQTVLHHAVQAHSVSEEVIQFLLERGADPHVTDKSGQKPSDAATRAGKRAIAKLLESAARGSTLRPKASGPSEGQTFVRAEARFEPMEVITSGPDKGWCRCGFCGALIIPDEKKYTAHMTECRRVVNPQ
jgi:ankyrin repeat protein